VLRILYATPEYAPLVKTGGLGDVAGALPAALRRLGLDARVLLPGYPLVLAALHGARVAAHVDVFAQLPPARLLEAQLPGSVPAWIIDCPPLYDRSGPYQDAQGVDWPDNARRFGMLSRIAALLGTAGSGVSWRAQVVHANDWPTGLAPAYNALLHAGATASVITVHNLAFQGIFEPRWVTDLGLPASSFAMEGVEYHGRLSFLKAGLYYAHAITTVSPTYAAEIQREPLGMGLHGLLATRRDALTGILNGIDTQLWNPATDTAIAARYDATRLADKAPGKRALQERMKLEPRDDVLLLGSVGRLTEQKGIDLLIDAAPAALELPAQIVIVGTGERTLEQRVKALAARHPGRVAAFVGFDEALAHGVEAGADAFVMPSRFEPCGMNQMYSQRYGTPPVVHATGGLVDSVVDCTPQTLADGTATGFKFASPTRDALLGGLERCATAYRTPPVWRALQRNGMARDFGWDAAARQYAALYSRLAVR
jgi:starch synthase